ncbi:hypothetical protein [Phaeodactylibacter luteus]|uniref:T9SS type A sorting domain-containing protein n=1 Tax=Phaeodactylibacter luteus TaxID=1564516 RepID=A0A5C6RHY3_9BACT|nr:hypothetical protein [Phaeodactylibacter luteus]TXB62016.1 hypothetical protein FRY97_16165 [Phaeodactylibacter luteus]
MRKQKHLAVLFILFFWAVHSSAQPLLVSFPLTEDTAPAINAAGIEVEELQASDITDLTITDLGAQGAGWRSTLTNAYFEVILRPAPGYFLELTGLEFDCIKTIDGIQRFEIQYSLQNDFSNSAIWMDEEMEATEDVQSFAAPATSIVVGEGQELRLRWFGFNPTSSKSKWTLLSNTLNLYGVANLVANVSLNSDIVSANSPSTIGVPYLAYTSATGLTPANAFQMGAFTIRDGGAAADADNNPTVLESISFNFSNPDLLKTAMLFSDGQQLAEVPVSGQLVTFSQFSIQAEDDSGIGLELFVTFNENNVLDGAPVFAEVFQVAVGAGSSYFSSSNAGGALSNTLLTEVIATDLAFNTSPPDVAEGSTISDAVIILAVDQYGHRDLGFNEVVAVNAVGTALTESSVTEKTMSAGVASFSQLAFEGIGDDVYLLASSPALLEEAQSAHFNVTATPAAYISEFHYLDSDGSNNNNFVEVAIGNAYLSELADFGLTLYNGGDRALSSYASTTLNNFIQGQSTSSGFTYFYWETGLQDEREGIALSYQGGLLEFISYGGSFTPLSGVAAGVQSEDIGVVETEMTVPLTAIQRIGDCSGTCPIGLNWNAGGIATPGGEPITEEGPLAVSLAAFTAEVFGREVLLRWHTLTEEHSHQFILERSQDGRNFTNIGEVPAAGYSQSPQHYHWADRAPSSGYHYYRLWEVALDGTQSICGSVQVHLSAEAAFELEAYPNVFSDFVQVEWTAAAGAVEGSLLVLNYQGQVVYQKALGKLAFSEGGLKLTDVMNWPKGGYLLVIEAGRSVRSVHLLKQ